MSRKYLLRPLTTFVFKLKTLAFTDLGKNEIAALKYSLFCEKESIIHCELIQNRN